LAKNPVSSAVILDGRGRTSPLGPLYRIRGRRSFLYSSCKLSFEAGGTPEKRRRTLGRGGKEGLDCLLAARGGDCPFLSEEGKNWRLFPFTGEGEKGKKNSQLKIQLLSTMSDKTRRGKTA